MPRKHTSADSNAQADKQAKRIDDLDKQIREASIETEIEDDELATSREWKSGASVHSRPGNHDEDDPFRGLRDQVERQARLLSKALESAKFAGTPIAEAGADRRIRHLSNGLDRLQQRLADREDNAFEAGEVTDCLECGNAVYGRAAAYERLGRCSTCHRLATRT